MIKLFISYFNYFLKDIGYHIIQIPKEKSKTDNRFSSKEINKILSKLETVKLHYGCGPRILKGWINIDLGYTSYHKYMKYYTNKFYPESIRGDKSDFYAFDVTKAPLPFPENSVDIIFHEDFLEHLDQCGQILFLAETLRILKKGAIHRVNTPNLLASMKYNSNFSKGFEGVYVDEWKKWHHLNILTPKILEEMALMVGYSEVIFNRRDQSIIKEKLPLEYRPDPRDSSEDHNMFADLVK
ncbi:MAG: methyltransferase domain-containing protein [Candidatus Hermodarchaeota archaeon]